MAWFSAMLSGSVTLTVERHDGGVALVTLRRPDRLNAMSTQMFYDLVDAAAALRADTSVRIVVLTGEGTGFCAGFDRAEMADLAGLPASEMMRLQALASSAVLAWHELPQPVIAAVNGHAAGGGLSLALACDVRMASTAASLYAIFVRGGFSAGDLGASWFLPRIVGLGRAAELMVSGRKVDPDEALRIGLVTSVHEPEALVDDAIAYAQQVASFSPVAVRMSLSSLYANVDAPSLRTAVELENRGQSLLSPGPDVAENVAARLEGRPPVFPD